MLKSMTGFGRASRISDGREITVELRSVNHKFLDLSFRMPRSLSFIEETLRTTISQHISRGHIDVGVTYKNTRVDVTSVTVNEGIIKQYLDAGKKIAETYGVKNDLSLINLIRLPEVITIEETEDDAQALKELAKVVCTEAVSELCAMRVAEGEKLKADFLVKIKTIADIRSKLELRAPYVVKESMQKLDERISKIMPKGMDADPVRLATEIAIIADKACVDEELVRINTHLENLKKLLNDSEPVGRRADFLIQELNREFNTTGSKSADTEITQLVIMGKAEVEKLREQIQNIE